MFEKSELERAAMDKASETKRGRLSAMVRTETGLNLHERT